MCGGTTPSSRGHRGASFRLPAAVLTQPRARGPRVGCGVAGGAVWAGGEPHTHAHVGQSPVPPRFVARAEPASPSVTGADASSCSQVVGTERVRRLRGRTAPCVSCTVLVRRSCLRHCPRPRVRVVAQAKAGRDACHLYPNGPALTCPGPVFGDRLGCGRARFPSQTLSPDSDCEL